MAKEQEKPATHPEAHKAAYALLRPYHQLFHNIDYPRERRTIRGDWEEGTDTEIQ